MRKPAYRIPITRGAYCYQQALCGPTTTWDRVIEQVVWQLRRDLKWADVSHRDVQAAMCGTSEWEA